MLRCTAFAFLVLVALFVAVRAAAEPLGSRERSGYTPNAFMTPGTQYRVRANITISGAFEGVSLADGTLLVLTPGLLESYSFNISDSAEYGIEKHWETDLGGASAEKGMVLTEDCARVLVPGSAGSGDGILRAIDVAAGAQAWRYPPGTVPARPLYTTPSVKGTTVCFTDDSANYRTENQNSNLYCLNTANGAPRFTPYSIPQGVMLHARHLFLPEQNGILLEGVDTYGVFNSSDGKPLATQLFQQVGQWMGTENIPNPIILDHGEDRLFGVLMTGVAGLYSATGFSPVNELPDSLSSATFSFQAVTFAPKINESIETLMFGLVNEARTLLVAALPLQNWKYAWHYQFQNETVTSPMASDRDQRVFVGTSRGRLYVFEPSSTLIVLIGVADSAIRNIVLGSDGIIFVSTDSHLFAVGPNTEVVPTTTGLTVLTISTTTGSFDNSTIPPPKKEGGGLSNAQLAGIIVGVVLFVIIVACVVGIYFGRKKIKKVREKAKARRGSQPIGEDL